MLFLHLFLFETIAFPCTVKKFSKCAPKIDAKIYILEYLQKFIMVFIYPSFAVLLYVL